MSKVKRYNDEDLREIELELKNLSLKMIDLLSQYKEQGIIDEEQYQQYIKIKVEFLQYLKNKEEE